jgi:hypothetical protein
MDNFDEYLRQESQTEQKKQVWKTAIGYKKLMV